MSAKVAHAKQLELEEEEKQRLEARNKDAELQQERIREIIKKKQQDRNDRLARLYQTQDQQLRATLLDNREDRILNKQVEEAEAKSIKIWQEQHLRRENLKQQVEQSRKGLIEKRQAERELEKQQEREFAEYMKIRN
jgi:hypothetical protein